MNADNWPGRAHMTFIIGEVSKQVTDLHRPYAVGGVLY